MDEIGRPPARCQFVDRGACRVLLVDYSGLSPRQHIRELDSVRQVIVRQPLRSVLLMHLTNDHFTGESADAIKHYTRAVDPHVRANAVVCRPGFRVAFNAVLNCEVQHEIRCFERQDDAWTWLTEMGATSSSGTG